MPRKNHASCFMYLYLSDNKRYGEYAESPIFLRGCADGSDVLQASLPVTEDFRQHRCLCQTRYERIPAGHPKNLRPDHIGCWSVGTCAKANVTGLMSGDRFLRGVHACDGFLHLFFLQETHSDEFLRPLFLVMDFFVVACGHASDVHLGAFGSRSHNATDHWGKLAVKADASCQRSDMQHTIDNRNAEVSPSSSLTGSLRCNLQLESAICVALLSWLWSGAKEMA